jgi:glycosyltransferase involved in cell wall biosynthesis
MKKICYITTVHGTLRSFVLKTANFIHENTDWEISFICNYDADFAQELPGYINYIPVNMARGISLSGIKSILEIKKILKREKFDLVQFSTPNASLYAAIASKMAKIPVRLYCQWGMVFVGFEGFKRKIFKTIEKLVCRLATHIQPDSKSNLDFSIAEGLYPAEKGAVVWNGSACGINLSKFDVSKKDVYRTQMREELNIKPDDFVFGFVGRITRDKGVNELLAAFKELYSAHPNAKLIMVGVPENVQTLNQDLYDWAQESSAVIFTGRSNVVEQHLSAMDTYILPSYREGFGMGVIEAEAMGVPVIVTDIPGPIDAMINEKTGLTVPKKDAVALENAMQELLNNKELTLAYGQNGIIHAKNNFEQQQFLEKVLNNRKKLLGE